MTDPTITAQAREIAAGLSARERNRVLHLDTPDYGHRHPGDPVNIRLVELGVLKVRDALDPWPCKSLSYCDHTEMGRAVAAVLAEGGV